MKIEDLTQRLQIDAYVNNVEGPQQNRQQDVQQRQDAAPDRVEFSTGSRLMQRVADVMKVEEPGRAEMVEALKQQVQQGTYAAEPGGVADAMMRDLLKELG
ncbi:flagellar biosynthesis anti-sigma factor FlgM [Dissulfurirhabdus thermomarina]|uniref:Negative regulator of flagellin synthesis n=1 Tax=Dissulfurirhabdus thermomarina TaxID=1765737 RepID=A0A6N9TS20_DISTH|nr:flagellar biosynthesis anti-sigma factor FlgM [Dissulfurirhabdus thermomarina]NDY42237.1 flagellar biosynthesis anti-sigma factor FlgM [Dissulfurirhabdus thermomarina]NMX23163.1 flagellar biosynthesis anti-sigma factor FlgM [Dissulfurirhabdus thermomarina]